MKHLTLSLLCAGLVALAACNKEKTMQPTQQPATEKNKPISGSVKKEKDPPKWSHAWWHPIKRRCQGRKGNCVVIETIVVTPHFARLIAGVSENGSSPEVGATFRLEGLSELMGYTFTEAGYADKLQSGDYYIARTSDDGKEACYIAGTHYPVRAENMEFAFQFAYGEIEE
jgi:hypothetical protein